MRLAIRGDADSFRVGTLRFSNFYKYSLFNRIFIVLGLFAPFLIIQNADAVKLSCSTRLSPASVEAQVVKVSELTNPEVGSIFENYPQIKKGMLEQLALVRRTTIEINSMPSGVMSPEQIFSRGMSLRKQIVLSLRDYRINCQACEPFQREVDQILGRIEALTLVLELKREEEIGKISENLSGHYGGQVIRNLVGDILGQVTELYGFGMLNNPRRGIKMGPYLATLFHAPPRSVRDTFKDRGIEVRMLDKEIDLMTNSDRVWVEVKAFDVESPGTSWRFKLISQMNDHLMLMKRLSVGITYASGTSQQRLVVGNGQKLRYFFLGSLPADLRDELVAAAKSELEALNKAYGGQALSVEFASIPLQ